ncbi:tyrosine-type recombinase/integrase [Amycolatopsis sp. NPDC004169]|uniref:tyrosine-type recombinase/integrase n=1 Tax=Amycolatopsis sp. NPDC004169 TaxID=3154453 RepID=UPI0033B96118
MADDFARPIKLAGLPPITLHGLRHGAATPALSAVVDIKVVQHMLRHSSIKVTMDLYTNVAEEVAADAARRVAGAIPRKALHPACTLGLKGDHKGQCGSGGNDSRYHKSPGRRDLQPGE